jgi:hypothetical protein
MNTNEQQKHRTAVQRLEADFFKTREDLTLLLEQHLRAQQSTHINFVRQHEAIIVSQNKQIEFCGTTITEGLAAIQADVQQRIDVATEPLRRNFFGRVKWAFIGR